MTVPLDAATLARLREGTEVLRTGGGATVMLTATECNALLDALAAAGRVDELEAALREAREAIYGTLTCHRCSLCDAAQEELEQVNGRLAVLARGVAATSSGATDDHAGTMAAAGHEASEAAPDSAARGVAEPPPTCHTEPPEGLS